MKWTSTGLLIATQAFSSTMNKIDEMIDRWESAVIPSNYNLVMYKGSEKTPAQQLEDDRAETDTGRIASNNSSVERAREMGKTTAEINERAAETIKYYTAS